MATPLTYQVMRTERFVACDCNWDSPVWRDAPALRLDHSMGVEPSHRPTVEARLLYDDVALYALFRVHDRWIRSVVTERQGPVCTDSCVELFLTPGADGGDGYFNIEVSCGGTALFRHQKLRGVDCRSMKATDIEKLEICHTLPFVVEPEIEEPTEWSVQYRVPYTVLETYAPVTHPRTGAVWKANLYKCADNTSHPHWLTWSPVDRPEPDFHRPESFGSLLFEG